MNVAQPIEWTSKGVVMLDQRLLPGEGVIDLTGFIKALDKIGYDDSLSVEVFGRGLKEMPPAESAKLCFDSSAAVFKKAGVPLR